MPTCDLCGAVASSEEEAMAWTTSVERGRTVRHCVACTRKHLRSMEGKLDSDWW